MQKHQQLQQLLNEAAFPEKNFENISKGSKVRVAAVQVALSLELIISALVAKGYDYRYEYSELFYSYGLHSEESIPFTPLTTQPMKPQTEKP